MTNRSSYLSSVNFQFPESPADSSVTYAASTVKCLLWVNSLFHLHTLEQYALAGNDNLKHVSQAFVKCLQD